MMTITEALAEVNLVKKKIAEKELNTSRMLFHVQQTGDPLEKQGGSATVLRQEQQALDDLRKRLVKIRSAISKANNIETITIADTTRTIFDWLTWRREVYIGELNYQRVILNETLNKRRAEEARPQVTKDKEGNVMLVTWIYNANQQETQEKIEKLEEIHGKLDGLLSLKNATIVIDV